MPVMGPSCVSTVTGLWASAAAATSSRAAASMKEARRGAGREFKNNTGNKRRMHWPSASHRQDTAASCTPPSMNADPSSGVVYSGVSTVAR